jgi:hypothetical protein
MILNDITSLISIYEGGVWDQFSSLPYALAGPYFGPGAVQAAQQNAVASRLALSGRQMSATDMNELTMKQARRGIGGMLLGAGVGGLAGLAFRDPRAPIIGAGIGAAAGHMFGRGSASNAYVRDKSLHGN